MPRFIESTVFIYVGRRVHNTRANAHNSDSDRQSDTTDVQVGGVSEEAGYLQRKNMNVKSRSRERAAEETKVVAMRKGELEKADGKEGTGTARQGEGKYGSRNRPGDGEMQRVISDTTGRHLGSSDLDCMSRAPVSGKSNKQMCFVRKCVSYVHHGVAPMQFGVYIGTNSFICRVLPEVYR